MALSSNFICWASQTCPAAGCATLWRQVPGKDHGVDEDNVKAARTPTERVVVVRRWKMPPFVVRVARISNLGLNTSLVIVIAGANVERQLLQRLRREAVLERLPEPRRVDIIDAVRVEVVAEEQDGGGVVRARQRGHGTPHPPLRLGHGRVLGAAPVADGEQQQPVGGHRRVRGPAPKGKVGFGAAPKGEFALGAARPHGARPPKEGRGARWRVRGRRAPPPPPAGFAVTSAAEGDPRLKRIRAQRQEGQGWPWQECLKLFFEIYLTVL